MTLNLWSYYDSQAIEQLVHQNKFNVVKILLLPYDDGYEILLKINGEEETMKMSYEGISVLNALDYGVIPTTILSGICQAKENYIYNDCVIVEITDRRSQEDDIKYKIDLVKNKLFENKKYTVLRMSDNTLIKLTGISSRKGNINEEEQLIINRCPELSLFKDSNVNKNDPYNFINSSWFHENTKCFSMSRVSRLKKSLNWKDSTDGHFRCDFDSSLHRVKTKRLKNHLKRDMYFNKIFKNSPTKSHELKLDLSSGFSDINNILEMQRQTIFNLPKVPVTIYNECHEECLHKMIIRSSSSSSSGCHFRVSVHRCVLHNNHWGLLTIDQWHSSNSSTGPIRFPIPGGHDQARKILGQLSEMLNARQMSAPTSSILSNSSMTIPTNATTMPITLQPGINQLQPQINTTGVPTNPLQSPTPTIFNLTRPNSNLSTGWVTLDTLQSGKFIFDATNNPLLNTSNISANPVTAAHLSLVNPPLIDNSPNLPSQLNRQASAPVDFRSSATITLTRNDSIISVSSSTPISDSLPYDNQKCTFFNTEENHLLKQSFGTKDINLEDLF